jgi:hypothetical protein
MHKDDIAGLGYTRGAAIPRVEINEVAAPAARAAEKARLFIIVT